MSSRVLTLVGFAVIATAAAAWAFLAGRRGRMSLPNALRRLLAHPVGKVVLVAFWAFVGWHLFARGSGAFE